MWSTSTAIITLTADTKITTAADLRRLTNTRGMEQLIKDNYRIINLKSTFEDLIDCGKMLQIALTAAADEPCSKDILEMLSKYQNLVHESTITSHEFVNASIQALIRHKDALEILGFTEPEDLPKMLPDVLDTLVRCCDTATHMEKKAEAAATNVDVVTTLAETVLISAKNNLGTNAQKKKEIQDQIDSRKAEVEANKVLLEKYSKAVTELENEKCAAAKEASNACDRALTLEIVEMVLNSLISMVDVFASIKMHPSISAGKIIAELVKNHTSEKKEGSNAPGGSNTTAGTGCVMNTERMDRETELHKQQLLLDQAENSPDADTPEGKKKIEQAKKNLKIATDLLEKSKETCLKAAENEQQSAVSLEEKMMMLSKQYYEMMAKETETAAKQANDLEFLKTMKSEATYVEQAIFLLQFSYGILGRIKTTFLNIKTFWQLLANQYENIADMKDDVRKWGSKTITGAKSDDKYFDRHLEHFRNLIVRSGQSWASVGRVSLNAYDEITNARCTVDGIMMKLPIGHVSDVTIRELVNNAELRIEAKVVGVQTSHYVPVSSLWCQYAHFRRLYLNIIIFCSLPCVVVVLFYIVK